MHFPHYLHFKMQKVQIMQCKKIIIMTHRFKLEPYNGVSTRHTCPECEQKRCFSRYIDTEKEITFPDYVGRCDHEQKCGYHHSPKEYFEQNPENRDSQREYHPPTRAIPIYKPTSYIHPQKVINTLTKYSQNNLYIFLSQKLGEVTAKELMIKYRVGTAKYWDGATIFWQIDSDSKIRTGKIMLYNPKTGRRVKKPHNHITWVHSLLGDDAFNLKQCFFGEHLLPNTPLMPVAIVESEKSALIASHYLPSFTWIATGGKNGCFRSENLSPLKGRQVILFPDLGATDNWQAKMSLFASLGIDVKLFDYLEQNATCEQRDEGYDIADFLLKGNHQNAILQELIDKNLILKTLIDKFDLELVEIEKTDKPAPKKRSKLRL